MAKIGSPVDLHSPTTQNNADYQQKLREKVIEWRDRSVNGGSERSKERHRALGKFLVRERIEKVLDPATPFFEIGKLAGDGIDSTTSPCAGIVTGLGYINNSLVAVYANDVTVKGGSYSRLTVEKKLRVQELAKQLGLPSLYLVDSGGVNIEGMDPISLFPHTFGRIFFNIAQMSGLGLPQIAAALGQCAVGGAYLPTMCDESVMTDKIGTAFLAGPELVEAATGVTVDAETLGGASMHAKTSGVIDHVGATEEDSLLIVRDLLDRTRSGARVPAPPPYEPREPVYDIRDLPSLIPSDPLRKQMSMSEILARVVDGSQITEYKAEYGTSLICATARISGYPVGIIANNGLLYEDSAAKGANFIEICCQRGIPLLFLHDINGFMVGEKYEASGIARQGSKLMNAVANASTPKIVLVVGNSYGAGNFAMCGRMWDPFLMAAWPGGKMGPVGAEQACKVVAMRLTRQAVESGRPAPTEEELAEMTRPVADGINSVGSVFRQAASVVLDDIVLPEETRTWLTNALRLATLLPPKNPNYGIFRM